MNIGTGLRKAEWFRRGVRRRGGWRRRITGNRQIDLLAQSAARRWAKRKNYQPWVDSQRVVDAPFRDDLGRGYWYPLDVYPVGCDIESTVRVAGGGACTPERLRKFADGRLVGQAGLICLRHTDPFRRKIWCTSAQQARIEAERHGIELEDGPGAR